MKVPLMPSFDPILLARIQFAFTVSFHIIFPAFTIGLASYLAVLEWRWLRTNNPVYQNLYKLWVKIFAVAFGMGVVSGVVMSYQFGTNWSVFSDRVSNVLGPLLGYEVLTAFFLEASFLGIMLFGWGRVSKKMHFASTCIVAGGTLLSAFWILSANSWMQTPQGFEMGPDGRLNPTNWMEIIFNPSFPYRYVHMVTAAYLTTALMVGGLGAWYLLKKRHKPEARVMVGMATLMLAIVAPIQILIGDLHGLNTLEHQPIKVAAMEGIWETERGAGLRLFALIDEKKGENTFEVQIPKLASLILTHDWNGEIKGLNHWAKEEHPPVNPVFWSFRVMVGLGVLMALLGVVSGIQYFRGKLFTSRPLLYGWGLMMPSGFIALLAGWFVTEIGRQPYTVFGLIKTMNSVSPAIMGPQVAWSLLGFVVIYSFVFGWGWYYIIALMKRGGQNSEETYYAHGLIHGTQGSEVPHV